MKSHPPQIKDLLKESKRQLKNINLHNPLTPIYFHEEELIEAIVLQCGVVELALRYLHTIHNLEHCGYHQCYACAQMRKPCPRRDKPVTLTILEQVAYEKTNFYEAFFSIWEGAGIPKQ